MIIDTDHPLAKDIFVHDNENKRLHNIIKFDPTTGEVWQPVFTEEGRIIIAEDRDSIKIEVTTYPAPLHIIHRDGRVLSLEDLEFAKRTWIPHTKLEAPPMILLSAATWPTLAQSKPEVGTECEWVFIFPKPGYLDSGVGTWAGSNNPNVTAEGFMSADGEFNVFDPQYLHWKPVTRKPTGGSNV